MLNLRNLALEDFGPYRGSQSIAFPSEHGVYIVYGPNGRGKTTLHNAFRYALYGEIRGRNRARAAREMANTDSAKERGYAMFKTVLDFDADGAKYRLTRVFDQSKSQVETTFLERDGVPLSQVQTRETLKVLAPPSISQFFLFDGEQLQQYENLLDTDSEEGEALEKSIERVLGIPVVASALADVKSILRISQRLLADQYAANDATKRMGVALKEAQDLRAEFLRSQSEISGVISDAQDRVVELESLLKGQEKSQRILGNLDILRARTEALVGEEKQAIAALAEVTPDIWKAMLYGDVSALVPVQEEAVNAAQALVFESSAAIRDIGHLAHDSDCPTCRRELDAATRIQLLERIGPLASDAHLHDAELGLRSAQEQMTTLRDLLRANVGMIVDRDRGLRGTRLERRANLDEIADLESQLAGIDEHELRTLAAEREERIHQISRNKERLEEGKARVSEQDNVIDGLMRKLKAGPVQVDSGVELKKEVAQSLTDLFASAIDAYRAVVRSRVEREASQVFRSISSEPDYAELQITDRYGLKIVDVDGEVVENRSAGYEHLVALSLIAALQDSAAVRGPVVMDYPFGRLDKSNTANVVAALPRMARQVVLLAFDGEFDRDEALRALGGSLIAEYELVRVSSSHTEISEKSA